MIKELLLSLAVAAFSGVSSFVGSPKRANSGYEITAELYSNPYLRNITGYIRDNEQKQEQVNLNTIGNMYFDDGFEFYVETQTIDERDYTVFELYADKEILDVSYVLSYSGWDSVTENNSGLWTFSYKEDEREEQGNNLTFVLSNTAITYNINKQLYNCSISSTPELPQTFTSAEVGQTFVIYGAANSDLAGDYGFNASSLSVSGAPATALSLTNEIGNTGYYRGCSFSVNLPANSFTITLRAYRPEYSITATLNNCTVSPSVPSSYSGLYAEDFTFTAASGYAFNSVVTSWEFSANITAQEPTFSGKLYGSLYESVTFRLVFENGNCEFRITAVSFNLDSYAEGYDSGYTIGYDKGHADGLIAGDSYGVWNWLKQAARTTGEFLSIPLLPGFSIGGLLTALAGLMIIWLFIKGFLFKS